MEGLLLQLGHKAAADGQEGTPPDVPRLHHAREESDCLSHHRHRLIGQRLSQ